MYAPSSTYTAGNVKDKLFERLLASGPGINIVINPADHKLVFYNERFTDKFKYTDEEIAGGRFSILSLLAKAEHERFLIQVADVCRGQQPGDRHGTYPLLDKNGVQQLWHIYGSEFKLTDGSDAESYCHLYLLPEVSKKKIPFLSFESRELFFAQFEHVNFGTYEWFIGLDRVFWSEGIYDIYELDKSRRNLDYDYVCSFIHPQDVRLVKATVQKALDTPTGFELELRIITASQQTKIISSVGNVILSQDGSPVKIVGTVRDITESRRIEQDLEKHVLELNRSNKELEEFAYVASHDLQEPLRKITTFSGRLVEKYGPLLTGDGTIYLDRMVASADNMRILINNLLEFSRVTRDTQPFENVNLKFILHQVLNDLELSIEETGTKLLIGDMPVIKGSMSQMKQLFTNIINNAIKFRKPGEASLIQIHAEPLGEEDELRDELPLSGPYFKITVSDNGIGFANEYAGRIFQIFQRLNGKSEYPGSGIGLAICKKIVDHHNGLIYATGAENEGAQFTIILPAAAENTL